MSEFLSLRAAAAVALLCAAASASAQTLIDPTRPSAPAPAAAVETARLETAPRWQLQSTVTTAHRSFAVINGQIVGQGDRVDGARVLRVEPGRVALDTGHGTRELQLASLQPVKTPVRAR